MSVRSWIATAVLNNARSIGRLLGTELVVEVSQHSIKTTMDHPNKEDKAWDPDMYKHGQLYYEGYANPIKPRAKVNKGLEDPDEIDIEESEQEDTEEEVSLISSARYHKYMRQDLISQLLTPTEKWRLIAYAVLGVGALQFINMVITLWATGSF